MIQIENPSVAAGYVRLDRSDDPLAEGDSEGNRRTPPEGVDWTFWDVVNFQRDADRFSESLPEFAWTNSPTRGSSRSRGNRA